MLGQQARASALPRSTCVAMSSEGGGSECTDTDPNGDTDVTTQEHVAILRPTTPEPWMFASLRETERDCRQKHRLEDRGMGMTRFREQKGKVGRPGTQLRAWAATPSRRGQTRLGGVGENMGRQHISEIVIARFFLNPTETRFREISESLAGRILRESLHITDQPVTSRVEGRENQSGQASKTRQRPAEAHLAPPPAETPGR